MSKITLAAHLKAELPRIDAALSDNVASMSPPVRRMAEHVLHAGGKRLRPMLTVLMAHLLGYRDKDIYPLAATMEMMHAATLLHDDVIDNADTRRGKIAAHRLFGVTEAILAGDALLARASSVIASYRDMRLADCIALSMEKTAAGQILELERQAAGSLDLDGYFEVIQGKTAWMIRASCELGAIKAGADEATVNLAAEYGLQLGMAFQIVDDALDFTPSGKTGKPEGGDLREGKLTPPLHLYLESLPAAERQAFCERFAKGDLADAEVIRITGLVRAGGFDIAARDMADSYLDKARAAFISLTGIMPESKEKTILEAVIRYVRDREI